MQEDSATAVVATMSTTTRRFSKSLILTGRGSRKSARTARKKIVASSTTAVKTWTNPSMPRVIARGFIVISKLKFRVLAAQYEKILSDLAGEEKLPNEVLPTEIKESLHD